MIQTPYHDQHNNKNYSTTQAHKVTGLTDQRWVGKGGSRTCRGCFPKTVQLWDLRIGFDVLEHESGRAWDLDDGERCVPLHHRIASGHAQKKGTDYQVLR